MKREGGPISSHHGKSKGGTLVGSVRALESRHDVVGRGSKP